MIGPRLIAAALALATTIPSVAFADDLAGTPLDAATVVAPPLTRPNTKEEANLDQRLAFLQKRISVERLHAEIWWGTFVAFYGAGALVQTGRAASETTPADQADLWISVAKSTAGVVRLLVDPMKGIKDFKPIPGESKQARVARGERILKSNAKATTPFGPWYSHLINLGLNGAGAVIVGAGFDDWKTGLISAGVGFGIGELSLLTQPWEADSDLEEYESRFGERKPVRKAPDVSWMVVPSAGGASLNASF